MQGGCFYGLVITGNDTNIFGSFDTDLLVLDGTSNPEAYGLFVDAVGGYVAPQVKMRFDIAPSISGRTSNPAVYLRYTYGQYDFSHSNFMYEKFIHVEGGVDGFFPTIRIKDAIFHKGSNMENIRNLFTLASRGWVNVIFGDNTEKYGGVGSIVNGGNYTDYKHLINITGNTTFSVIV